MTRIKKKWIKQLDLFYPFDFVVLFSKWWEDNETEGHQTGGLDRHSKNFYTQ